MKNRSEPCRGYVSEDPMVCDPDRPCPAHADCWVCLDTKILYRFPAGYFASERALSTDDWDAFEVACHYCTDLRLTTPKVSDHG
jgi:hypothetical protein